MTDYTDLRAALEAGPTPGPWKVSSESDYPSAIDGPNDQEVLSGCGCCGSPNLAKKDADHIAACDPDTIRALLAERDALREALEIARDFVAEALVHERVAYRGYESASDIANIEHCLGQIDAVLRQTAEYWNLSAPCGR